MFLHSAKQGELRQFTQPQVTKCSFKARHSHEGHFHMSCSNPSTIGTECHGFHATHFLPATKAAEGGNGGARMLAWPTLPGNSGATSSSTTESWCSSCPRLALVPLCAIHRLSICLQCGTVHPPWQRPLPLPPFPAQGVCSVNNSSFRVLWPAHVPGTGPAALYQLPQSSQEVVLSLANAWHGVAFRKLSPNEWTYAHVQIRNWV